MTYQYIDPLDNGFERINVSRANHNKLFKHKQRTFLKDIFTTVEYYENKECVRVQFVPSLFSKVILLTISPVLILFYGLANKDTYTDIKKTLFAKKYGAFTVDTISNKQKIKQLKGEPN